MVGEGGRGPDNMARFVTFLIDRNGIFGQGSASFFFFVLLMRFAFFYEFPRKSHNLSRSACQTDDGQEYYVNTESGEV